MPFPGHIRRRYTWSEINRVLPKQRGVFGFYNERDWLYIGYSEDIRSSLIEHWETDAALDRLAPAGWSYEITNTPRLRSVLLIAELRPVLNVRDRSKQGTPARTA